MTAISIKESDEVIPSLKVLTALIKKDLVEASTAGRPYYERIGKNLVKVRDIYFKDDLRGFYAWAEKEFGKTQGTIRSWVAFGASPTAKYFKNKEDHATAPKSAGGLGQKPQRSATRHSWARPVDTIAHRAFDEARRLALEAALTRKQEREADHKLARRLISIGFKVLAQELHPDKGGAKGAMARLNRVYGQLKECIGEI